MELFKKTWKVVRTIWPYPEGYGTVFYLHGKRTIVDSGLSKEEAESIVQHENSQESCFGRNKKT